MSDYDEQWKRIERVASRTAVDTAWRQWAALGSLARPASNRRVRRVVDPEALILLSLAFREEERRLVDMLWWWAVVGAPLTSLQRMRTLVDQLSEETERDFALFASWAAASGHRSWKRYAVPDERSPPPASRRLKGPADLELVEPSTLMLRMRAAFGVGAKPDVLTYLIGLRGGMATVSVISRAVAYTETAVREALKDMAVARLVHETTDRPAYYTTAHRPWVDLLDLDARWNHENEPGPSWGMWVPLFGLLVAARDLAARALAGEESEHVTASHARDAVERYAYAINFHDIPVPDPDRYRGREFAVGFCRTIERVSHWMGAHS